MEATPDDLMHEPPAQRPAMMWWEADLLLLGTMSGSAGVVLGNLSSWFYLLDSAGIIGCAGFLISIFTRNIRQLRSREPR